MRNQVYYILLVLLISAFLRIWNLADVPAGLNIDEVNFGLWASSVFGVWMLNPFFVRLPFALLGIIEVLLFYLLLRKWGQNFNFSLVSAGIVAVLPWHIQLSRVFSLGLVILGVFLILFLLLPQCIRQKSGWLVGVSIVFGIVLFLIGLLQVPRDLAIKVDLQRNLSQPKLGSINRVFTNKLVESYRYRQNLLFENLDFGNYFFQGHPRERWGVEEIQKLYLTFLPLIVIGLFKFDRKLLGLVIISSILSVFLPVAFAQKQDLNILLLVAVVVLAVSGAFSLVTRKGVLLLFVFIFLFEFGVFLKTYFTGFSQTLFSPQRPAYGQLADALPSFARPGEQVLVSKRLDNVEVYLSFYNGPHFGYPLEFRDFNIWAEKDLDKLFVDVLPDDPSPQEPLYKKNGEWPAHINVLEQFYDKPRRQTIVVYRYN